MAVTAMIGMIFGVVSAVILSPIIDREALAMVLPVAFCWSLIVAAGIKKLGGRLLFRFDDQLLVFILCIGLAMFPCIDHRIGTFGLASEGTFFAGIFASALNVAVSCLLTAPIFFWNEMFLRRRQLDISQFQRGFLLPAISTCVYLGLAIPVMSVLSHFGHHGCLNHAGPCNVYVIMETFKVAIAFSTPFGSLAGLLIAFSEPIQAGRKTRS